MNIKITKLLESYNTKSQNKYISTFCKKYVKPFQDFFHFEEIYRRGVEK